ncbi:MAG: glutathione S-transferase family protein [Planctomycetes bacterium]|nr:glutathione S-transferase family protein [Planctomycetota bacterium]
MNRLVTIAVSHFCEKARWALDRAGLPYVEEAQAPLLHWAAAWRAGGGRTVPVLVTDDGVSLADSTDILRWVDARAGGGLYPADPAARREVDDLEDLFDETLGPHVRRWVYAFVLDDPALTRRLLTVNVPGPARLAYRLTRPAITAAMRKGMNITAASAERSRVKVEAVFDRVDALLADGRPFLAGDRFTAADLTFAALAAPATGVDGYGPPGLPGPEALPAALREAIAPLQGRPAGAHVARLYRDERRRRA